MERTVCPVGVGGRRPHADGERVMVRSPTTLPLQALPAPTGAQPVSVFPETLAERVRMRRGKRSVALMLDYDGTLVPHMDHPELAAPTPAVLDLLACLAAQPRTRVVVISGRTREGLEAWLGHLPIRLVAEHGLWIRGAVPGSWVAAVEPDLSFRPLARAVMDEATAHAPGSFVEVKSVGLAWHWRTVERVRGAAIAGELVRRLTPLLAGSAACVLPGENVVEVRPTGVDKGAAVKAMRRDLPAQSLLVCVGNDRTDEDMFAAAPRDAVTVRVGEGASRAKFRLASPAQVMTFLGTLAGR